MQVSYGQVKFSSAQISSMFHSKMLFKSFVKVLTLKSSQGSKSSSGSEKVQPFRKGLVSQKRSSGSEKFQKEVKKVQKVLKKFSKVYKKL